jgi:hypothetical protein
MMERMFGTPVRQRSVAADYPAGPGRTRRDSLIPRLDDGWEAVGYGGRRWPVYLAADVGEQEPGIRA